MNLSWILYLESVKVYSLVVNIMSQMMFLFFSLYLKVAEARITINRLTADKEAILVALSDPKITSSGKKDLTERLVSNMSHMRIF